MIKKLFSILVLMLIAHLSMSAAFSIVIHRHDGTEDAFLLEKKPILTFDEADLVINVEWNLLSIPRKDIKNIDFVENQDGITDPETIKTMLEIIDGNTIRINSVDSSSIRVYDLSGHTVSTANIVAEDEKTTVNLTSCPTGIYIIAYNNTSFKIVKR